MHLCYGKRKYEFVHVIVIEEAFTFSKTYSPLVSRVSHCASIKYHTFFRFCSPRPRFCHLSFVLMKLTRILVKHDSYHFEVSKVIDSLPLLFRACAKYGWGENVLKWADCYCFWITFWIYLQVKDLFPTLIGFFQIE